MIIQSKTSESSPTQKSACLIDAHLVPFQKILFKIFYLFFKQASKPPYIQSNCCLLQALMELKFTVLCDMKPRTIVCKNLLPPPSCMT